MLHATSFRMSFSCFVFFVIKDVSMSVCAHVIMSVCLSVSMLVCCILYSIMNAWWYGRTSVSWHVFMFALGLLKVISFFLTRVAGLLEWLTDQHLIGWLIDWWIDQLIDWLIDWSTDWLTDWLIDWFVIDWLIDWLVQWLNEWITCFQYVSWYIVALGCPRSVFLHVCTTTTDSLLKSLCQNNR